MRIMRTMRRTNTRRGGRTKTAEMKTRRTAHGDSSRRKKSADWKYKSETQPEKLIYMKISFRINF